LIVVTLALFIKAQTPKAAWITMLSFYV
jgi:hypothetical protein